MRRFRNVLLCAVAFAGALAGGAETASAVSGALYAWGSDSGGQVSNVPEGNAFVAIAAGPSHGLALDTNGRIHGWGSAAGGQLSNLPVGTGFTAIAAGQWADLAVNAGGEIEGWGSDLSGVLSGVPSGAGFVAVQVGSQGPAPGADPSTPVGSFGVALDASGQIHAWGADDMGQVSNAPVGTGFIAISCRGMHCLAAGSSGEIYAWGWDGFGQVSGVPSGRGFSGIAAGLFTSLALDLSRAIDVWGTTPAGTPAGNGYRAIAAGAAHNLAVDSAGAIHGWGLDISGEINSAPSETDFFRVAAGTYWSLALRAAPPAVPTLAFDGKLILGALLLGLAFSALSAKTCAA